jgi:putative ABC transport system permease protein
MSSTAFLETVWQDMRWAVRALRRTPGFAAIAILTLALGIGANAAIFSVVNAVLLRPLPWGNADRAVMIWSKWTAFDKTWVATGEVVDYRKRSQTLQEVAAWGEGQVNLTGDGEPERVSSAAVSANTFSTLGAAPMIGRTFTAQEDLPNGPRLVVLGFGLWNRRYSGDPSIVGRSVLINGNPFEVVGVMQPGFVLPTDYRNPEPSQLWTPLQMDPASMDHGSHGLYAAGRLKEGVTVDQAADELRAIAQAMTSEGLYPRQMEFDTVAVSLADEVLGSVRASIWLLFGAVGFLLLIACGNVANLLLARAEARQREIAVRAAIGASGFRVLRQLFTESLVVTGASTIAGLALAYAGVRLVAWWNPASIPRVAGVTLDMRVLVFVAIVSLFTSVLFSLAPALRAIRIDLADSLKDGGQGASTGGARQRFRNALVVVEMALAAVLLVGAALTLQSLWALQRVPIGFDPSNVITMRVALPAASYASPEQVVQFFRTLVDRVRELPGVQSAGAARLLPLGSTIGDYGLQIERYTPPPGTNAKGDWQIVTDGYLEAIGERVIRGRTITAADTSDTQLVALVNEELARRYFAGGDPIGGRMRIGGGNPNRPWLTIVGVVGDVRHNGISEPIKEKFYVPHTQWHRATGNPIRGMSIVARASTTDAASLVGPIRQAVRALDPNLPIANVRTMDAIVDATLSSPRFTGFLLATFATVALVLSAIGIYGVLSYLVSRRTREIGIRVAIGAGRAQVLRMVLGSGVGLALAGIASGLVAAFAGTRFMATVLHGISATDPLTFIVVACVLTSVAIAASIVPAWRATRVDPVIALKTE